MRRSRALPWLAATLVAAAPGAAADPGEAEIAGDEGAADEGADATREGERPTASVVSSRLTRRDLDHRLHLRPRDLLHHVPGLVAIARGAAATQLLVRGLDAGEGAGLEVTVDGVPINLGSHAYSQGHADLQFLIADTVESLALHGGSFAAHQGEHATAGSLELRTLDEIPGGGAVVRTSSGLEPTQPLRNRVRRLRTQLVGVVSPQLDRGSALLAAEIGVDDGPGIHPQRFRRSTFLGKWKRPVGDGTLTAALQLHSGRWFDAGLLPAGEIAAGRLAPFSSVDPTQGGIATRASASLAYELRDPGGATWHGSAYAVASDETLHDNPTLFLRDPEAGGALEHADRRSYYGARALHERPHRLGPVRARLRIGVQARSDGAQAATWHVERRLRTSDCFEARNPCTDTAARTADLAVFAEETLHLGRRLRVMAGLRRSHHAWNVDDRDPDTRIGPATLGGSGAVSRLDPKLGLSYAGRDVDLVLLAAAGHRGSDARAANVTSTYGAFARTYDGELGLRVRPDARLTGAIALWASRLADSAAWAADAGAAQRVPASRRHGVEARLDFRPTGWLAIDASLGIARGSLNRGGNGDGGDGDGGNDGSEPRGLPLAPRIAGTAGIVLHRPSGFVSARLRALGPRTTTDPALTARGHTLIDMIARRRWGSFELGAAIENLLDTRWYEAQRAGDVRASRGAEPARDLLVTPGVPLSVMLTLGYVR